jgi:hypothetical protein
MVLGGFLLVLVVALVVLLLVSLLAVYVTALAARRFGLPELHVMLAFLALLAVVVVGYMGVRIASLLERLHAAQRDMRATIIDTSDRIADELSTGAENLVDALDELPAVIVEPEVVRRGKLPPQRRR